MYKNIEEVICDFEKQTNQNWTKVDSIKLIDWLVTKLIESENKTADKCNVKNCAYHVITGNLEQIVIAENIASACDKLDKLGCSNYEFMSSASFEIIE